jgi:transcriptional regulator with XRE-family HTH domain
MDADPTSRFGVGKFLRHFMDSHRLSVDEVASAAGISVRSMGRLRSTDRMSYKPRPATLRRVADALGVLTQVDSDEIYRDLMLAAGQLAALAQGDLGIRGATELVAHYQRMSGLARHLLLEQARLLARELPADA